MLETIREFGIDQLTALGELDDAAARHLACFVGLAEAARRSMHRPDQIDWLDRLDADLGNLRSAFAWAIAHGETEGAAREAVALSEFWWHRGHAGEARSWLEQVIASERSIPKPLACDVYLNAAVMANIRGDRPAVAARIAEALRTARAIGDPVLLDEVLRATATFALFHDDVDQAARWTEEAIALRERAGAPPEGTHLALQALVAHRRGDLDRAAALFAATLTMFRPHGDRDDIANTLDYLGDVECDRGDYAAGLANYREALDLWVELKDGWGVADALVGIADAVAASGAFAEAARLLGAAEARYEAAGVALPPHDRPGYGRALAAARERLGEAAFQTARAAGHALKLDQAVVAGMA